MDNDLKLYLEQSFSKLARKEDIESVRGEMKALQESVRGDMKGLEERVLHQFHITAEALRDDIKQVAEGVINLNEKSGREVSQFRREVASSNEELKSMIKFSYA